MKLWKALLPLAVALVLGLIPPPDGLPQHAWWYFAIFAGVIAGLVLEPLPGGAIGFIGVAAVAVLANAVLFSPTELAALGPKWPGAALKWALSGFSNGTVWLIFAAFMFALGYEKTGLGRRIALGLVKLMGRKTLTLGYAVALSDLVLAPFTPSVTARSGGTVYPVIKNLPPLYRSLPNDPSAAYIGTYLMWTALATTCVTSTLFLTALAPNLLALELVQKTLPISVSWTDWFLAIAPVGILLLVLVPLLGYWIIRPSITSGDEVPTWAAAELKKMGRLTRQELLLGGCVVLALLLWIFGGAWIDATTVAIAVIAVMLMLGVLSWDDVISNKAAWNTLAWFATLVALAGGLAKVGFIKWLAALIGAQMVGVAPLTAMIVLVVVFFVLHYMFASLTAHVTALLTVMLAVGATIPGMNMTHLAMLLMFTLGIMGIISPYAAGPSPVYLGSGYIPAKQFWKLGAIFGAIFLFALLVIAVPWLAVVMP